MGKKAKNAAASNLIAQNRKAAHDYHLQDSFEAGLVLEGWEVKSLRANRVQLKDSYVVIKSGEAWLIGAHISPLNTASTHINPDPIRSRKLLLHKKELNKLIGSVNLKGLTIVPINLHWHKQRTKCKIALAQGKKQFDKRQALRSREWERDKQRLRKDLNRQN